MLTFVILGSIAVGISFVQTITDMPFSDYLLGNIGVTAFLLEVLILINLFLFSGTVASMVINAMAGIIGIMILKFISSWVDTKTITWDLEEIHNGKLGFNIVYRKATMSVSILKEKFLEFIGFENLKKDFCAY